MHERQQGVATIVTLFLSAMVGLGGIGAVVAFNNSSALLDDVHMPSRVSSDGKTSMQAVVSPAPSPTATPMPSVIPSPSPTVKAAIHVMSDAHGSSDTYTDSQDGYESAVADETGDTHMEASDQPAYGQETARIDTTDAVHIAL